MGRRVVVKVKEKDSSGVELKLLGEVRVNVKFTGPTRGTRRSLPRTLGQGRLTS